MSRIGKLPVSIPKGVAVEQRGRLSEARHLADEVLGLASAQDDPDLLLQAHHAAWTTLFFQDNIQTCLEHTERGIALYDIDRHSRHAFRFGGHDPGSCARSVGALALCLCGYPDKAVEQSREAITLGRRLELPGSLSSDLFFDAMLHQYRRDPDTVAKRLDELAVVCAERGILHYEGSAAILRGWTDVTRGMVKRGFAELRRGFAIHDRSPVGLRKAYYAARDYENAANWLGRVPKGDAKSREANFYLGLAAYLLGDFIKAENAFQAVVQQLPLTEVYNNLGVVATRRGRRNAIEWMVSTCSRTCAGSVAGSSAASSSTSRPRP